MEAVKTVSCLQGEREMVEIVRHLLVEIENELLRMEHVIHVLTIRRLRATQSIVTL